MINGDCTKAADENLIKLLDGTLENWYDERITTIKSRFLFFNNSVIKNIHLPNLVTINSYQPFGMTSNLNEFKAENLTTITYTDGATPFILSGIKKLIVPKLTTIPYAMVNQCYDLEEADFSGVKTISMMGLAMGVSLYNEKLESFDFQSLEQSGSQAIYNWKALKKIWLPESCTQIGLDFVSDCENVTIYTAHQSKPSGWDINWNYEKRPVVWGATHEEFLNA